MAIIVMIVIQVLVGGITRLTDSGLSITEWEVVKGVLPPIGEAAWQENFDKYKQIPQYEQLHPDMTLSEFKFIYFWEWIHRLWGRLIGLVVIVPFVIFWLRKQLSPSMRNRAIGGILLIGLVGSFGWIMVASGLGEDAWLWVDAYRLTMHLNLALLTLAYFIWVYLEAVKGKGSYIPRGLKINTASWLIVGLTVVQLLLGGLMSGAKAGRIFKTWPSMGGKFLPSEMSFAELTADAFINYQYDATMPTLVQFWHRISAYLLTALIIWFFIRFRKLVSDGGLRKGILWMHIAVVLQVVIGIAALLHGHPDVPVSFGLMHQAGAMLLLGSVTYVHFHVRNNLNA